MGPVLPSPAPMDVQFKRGWRQLHHGNGNSSRARVHSREEHNLRDLRAAALV